MPFADNEAPEVLRAAVWDIGERLHIVPEQGVTTTGSPDVRVAGQRHHCRHRWRLLGRPSATCGDKECKAQHAKVLKIRCKRGRAVGNDGWAWAPNGNSRLKLSKGFRLHRPAQWLCFMF